MDTLIIAPFPARCYDACWRSACWVLWLFVIATTNHHKSVSVQAALEHRSKLVGTEFDLLTPFSYQHVRNVERDTTEKKPERHTRLLAIGKELHLRVNFGGRTVYDCSFKTINTQLNNWQLNPQRKSWQTVVGSKNRHADNTVRCHHVA